jgi:phosphotransferase system HPr (HPr) family protein
MMTMTQKTAVIKNKLGLHARPAALFVQTASRFSSDITLSKDGFTVNGKSIMGVMMLAAGLGSEVVIAAGGDDEERAAEELVTLLESGFGEE